MINLLWMCTEPFTRGTGPDGLKGETWECLTDKGMHCLCFSATMMWAAMTKTSELLTPNKFSHTLKLFLSNICHSDIKVYLTQWWSTRQNWKFKRSTLLNCVLFKLSYFRKQDGSESKVTCHQVWQSEFSPQNPYGQRRELTPLTTGALCCKCTLTCTKKENNRKILKNKMVILMYWSILQYGYLQIQ